MRVPTITRETISQVTARGIRLKEQEQFALVDQPALIEFIDAIAREIPLSDKELAAYKSGMHMLQRCLEATDFQ